MTVPSLKLASGTEIYVITATKAQSFFSYNREVARNFGLIFGETDVELLQLETDKLCFIGRFHGLNGSALKRIKQGNFKALCQPWSSRWNRPHCEVIATGGQTVLQDPYFVIPHPSVLKDTGVYWRHPYFDYYKARLPRLVTVLLPKAFTKG